MKKIPMRTCVVTREKLEKTKTSKILDKHLEVTVPFNIYEDLKERV